MFTKEDRVEEFMPVVVERQVIKSIIITLVNWQIKQRTEMGLEWNDTYLLFMQQTLQF